MAGIAAEKIDNNYQNASLTTEPESECGTALRGLLRELALLLPPPMDANDTYGSKSNLSSLSSSAEAEGGGGDGGGGRGRLQKEFGRVAPQEK